MKLTKQLNRLNEGDEVYCVLNHAVTGIVTKKKNYHGQYHYTIKAHDAKGFKTWIGVYCQSVIFLDWQLKKSYREVVKNERQKRFKGNRRKIVKLKSS